MVKNRQVAIPEVEFRPPVGTAAGVEVLTLAELRSRTDERHRSSPHRPAFHHLIAVHRGLLRHTVDFTAYDAGPGTWLWVRPGQVHRWGDLDAAHGTLVLFRQDFLDPATVAAARLDDPHATVARVPVDPRALDADAGHLARAAEDPGPLPFEIRLDVLRHLLAVLVLRLAHLDMLTDAPAADLSETFVRLRNAVEQNFGHSRRVEDYARTLGYSPRTLSRATLAAAGVTAKEFVDRRVILEAKRLLAHGDHTAAQIASRLGFTSATNFSKYFHQRTGSTPIGFRAAIRLT
jgi:AraC-like DNA-binding protein